MNDQNKMLEVENELLEVIARNKKAVDLLEASAKRGELWRWLNLIGFAGGAFFGTLVGTYLYHYFNL